MMGLVIGLGTILAGVGAAAQIIGTMNAADAASDQADAQRASIAAQQKASGASAQRERIQAVRQARIQRAQMLSASGQAGIGQQSSGVVGASSSISSQLGSNIGFQNVQQGFADMASTANQQAADAGASAAQWQAIAGIGGKALEAGGGWTRIFGGNTIPSVKKT